MPGDKTEIGGVYDSFRTTQWTQILSVRASDPVHRRATLELLIHRYWKPVYCFLLRKGNPNEKAKDLTQGFFMEVVFGRDLIRQADRAKGRFRTFLLTALERYVVDVHRFDSARKRMPPDGLARLDAIDPKSAAGPSHGTTPLAAFNYAWATALINEVLTELEMEYRQGGKEAHWSVFCARVVRPILDAAEPPALSELCARFGVEDEAKASNMIVTAKRRFRSILKRHVGESVDSDEQIDSEIVDLMKILATHRPGL